LTAVPIVPDGKRRIPSEKKLTRAFVKNGEKVDLRAIEKGPIETVVVWDPVAHEQINVMRNAFSQEIGRRLGNKINWKSAKADERFRAEARFPPDTWVNFMEAHAAPVFDTDLTENLFSWSEKDSSDGGLLWKVVQNRPQSFEFRLADTVAMAGVMAQARGSRRAVVLVLGSESLDRSEQSPAQVREYLRLLRVPLYVWSTSSKLPHPDWGEVTFVGCSAGSPWKVGKLSGAVDELASDLKSQRIAWIDGFHLPHSIELSDQTRGIRLAGMRKKPLDSSRRGGNGQ
jgi:hypothetical protein